MAPAATPARIGAALVALLALAAVVVEVRDDGPLAGLTTTLTPTDAVPRGVEPYEGLGAWVDAFDYGPAYAGGDPAVTPDDVAVMAETGVRTLYLQANRDDERSPEGFVDRGLVDAFVREAHEHGVEVVAWYLPTFRSVEVDLGHLQDLLDYQTEGHRFDGVAVDIEYTAAVPDTEVRNERLVELSRRLDRVAGEEAIGAIVLPPVLTEVVNPDFWPRFPWRQIGPHYDVWLPMSYWTDRRSDSGYRDGAAYHRENHERMVANLGDRGAIVHGIGGIGDQADQDDLVAFAGVLAETGAVGGSIYDWATLGVEGHGLVRAALARHDLA
jgi:hypothetical protein